MRISFLLRLARNLFLAAGVLAAPPAQALDSPLRIMAPAAPATGWDHIAHLVGDALVRSGAVAAAEVGNVPGASGATGLAEFVRDANDGEHLMVTGLAMIGAVLINRSAVGLDRVTPIARLANEYLVIVLPAESPLRSVADLAAALRADPTKLAWAGGLNGSVPHLAAILLAEQVGADVARLAYVPFPTTADALAAVEEGKVAAAIVSRPDLDNAPPSERRRVLAVTADHRLEGVDAPTLKEEGIDLVLANWRGVVAPAWVSEEHRTALSDALAAATAIPEWEAAMRRRHWESAFLGTHAFAAFLGAERERVKAALRSAGIVKRPPDPALQ
jgi:putative tricarboxylic transport membrane protein